MTRTAGPSSPASWRVRWMTAAFVTLYQPIHGSTAKPPIEATFSTDPPCSAIHAFAASWVQTSTAVWLTWTVLFARGTSRSTSGPKYGLVPALLTSTSRAPKRFDGGGDAGRCLVGLAGVGGEPPRCRPERTCRCLEGVGLAGSDHHLRARLDEAPRRREPDPPRSTGDKGDLAAEAELHEAHPTLLTWQPPRAPQPVPRTASPLRRAPTSASTATIPSTGTRGARRLSPGRGSSTARSFSRSATRPATGATSWGTSPSPTRRRRRR